MASAKSKGKKRVSDTRITGQAKKTKTTQSVGEASSSGTQQQGEEKPKIFRLMDLPPELRLEIYRACLARPFDVLLAKNKAPIAPQTRDDDESGSDDDGSVPAAPPSTSATAGAATGWANARQRAVRAAHSATRLAHAASSSSGSRTTRAQAAAQAASGAQVTMPSGNVFHTNHPSHHRRAAAISQAVVSSPRAHRPQDVDPLIVALLRTTKQIYKEARPILYSENTFILNLSTALPTLSALHQRSRGQIRHLRLTIPTHNEILERFAEVVRLSLRYCWRLKSLVVNMPFVLPGAEGSGTSGNASVYANAFDILRWLPRQCEVVLEGQICEEIREVVERNAKLAKGLDELAYARRQLISNEGDRLPISDPPLA